MSTDEDPVELLRRLKLGREEFCQRLLTTLIIRGPYPLWNSRNPISPKGQSFLKSLHQEAFGESAWDETGVFVDELDMPRRNDEEQGCAPDYAVFWRERLWMTELKTEKGSHRRGQLTSYFEFARHYYPNMLIDLTYLTPPLQTAVEAPGPWARFSHISWDVVRGMIRDIWGSSEDPRERRIADCLVDTLQHLLTEKPSEWRSRLLANVSEAPSTGSDRQAVSYDEGNRVLDEALKLAALTASDGKQRALNVRASDLEELQAWRLEIRNALQRSPKSEVRYVRPWLWGPSSGGAPLTEAGGEVGYELRLSRYAKPRP